MWKIKKTVLGTCTCINCNANLEYKSGTEYLNCEHCGARNEILQTKGKAEELDFHMFLAKKLESEEAFVESFVKCGSCGVSSTLETNVASALCPYCSIPLVVENAQDEKIIQPNSLLPFKLDIENAKGEFQKWVKKLWFVPNHFKEATSNFNNFKGIYIPYWTFNTDTTTKYKCQISKHYYEKQYYVITEKGKEVTKHRRVKKVKWNSINGSVQKKFDAILTVATKSLPKKYIYKLEPWDLENLVPFDESYLKGFITEKYQIDLGEGFNIAKGMVDPKIRKLVKKAMGGGEKRNVSMNTSYNDITSKHLLLPVFVSTYTFKGKLFQFLVNARTGEVQGQRPYDWKKIALVVLVALVIIALGIYLGTLVYNNK